MQLSAGGGRDSTAPTKQLNPQTGLMVLKGTAVWTLLVEPCRPEPHLHALASAVHRPQWRSFKEDGELPEGWKASGSKDPNFYCAVCFTFAPRREEANTFIITSASDRIELFRGEKETRRLSESRTHRMSLKIKLCSKSECIKAHSVFVHTEEDTGRTNSADSRISLHSSGSTSVRTAAADTRELMLGSQHQLSSAQTCWTRSRSKNQTGKTFLSVDVRRKPDRHHHHKEQTNSWAEWLTDIQQPAAVRPAQCLTQCDSVTAGCWLH